MPPVLAPGRSWSETPLAAAGSVPGFHKARGASRRILGPLPQTVTVTGSCRHHGGLIIMIQVEDHHDAPKPEGSFKLAARCRGGTGSALATSTHWQDGG